MKKFTKILVKNTDNETIHNIVVSVTWVKRPLGSQTWQKNVFSAELSCWSVERSFFIGIDEFADKIFNKGENMSIVKEFWLNNRIELFKCFT